MTGVQTCALPIYSRILHPSFIAALLQFEPRVMARLTGSGELLIDILGSGADEILVIADKSGQILATRLDELPVHVQLLLSSDASKVFLHGKQVLKTLSKAGYSVNGSILDLELASQLLGMQSIDARITALKGPEEWVHAIFSHCSLVTDRLDADGMSDLASLEFNCLPIVVELEATGIAVDWPKVNSLGVAFSNKLAAHMTATKRIQTTYKQLGSETGRITSSNFNIQGVPRDRKYRQCFVAEPGHKFIIGDYSQMELRVVAEVTVDAALIDLLKRHQDLHRSTAAVLSGKPECDISPTERHAAKAINFGLIYGMGIQTLCEKCNEEFGVSWSALRLEDFKRGFFARFRGIADWHSRLKKDSVREIRTLSNRVRRWHEPPAPMAKYNSIAQGSAADILKKSLVYLNLEISGTSTKLVGLIHDEILDRKSVV